MTLTPGVFKAYDVRGLYGDEIDEAGAHRVGRAFVDVVMSAQSYKRSEPAMVTACLLHNEPTSYSSLARLSTLVAEP